MKSYELTISPNYVPEWTVVEAIRELFQNALDQQVIAQDSEVFFDYDSETKQLTIGNKSATLQVQSLLLGGTTKADDSRTIGKFGEGYKIATLVLLRLGKTITFYNYGNKEVWKPRFVNSRRYGTRVLTFFVDRKFIWQSVPNHNLTIVIEGITEEDYELIARSNLHIHSAKDVEETSFGRVLLDEEFSGKVFVNGLYICHHKPYKCGYDFLPEHIKLDRDRKLVSDFELHWLSSRIWSRTENSKKLIELLQVNAPDVYYVSSNWTNPEAIEAVFEAFTRDHGDKAIPVLDQSELEEIPVGYKPIIVGESYAALVKRSWRYVAPSKIKQSTPIQRLEEWFGSIQDKLTIEECENFESILRNL